ncbi:hypothetical protein FRB90_010426 [Tulasnella sp. 427]|nr:hypothetical protein FRB90_010426 [Tulasnella sp. 427]
MVQANSADGHVEESIQASGSSKVSKSKSRRALTTPNDTKSSKSASAGQYSGQKAVTETTNVKGKDAKKAKRKPQQEESELADPTLADPPPPVDAEDWSWLPLANEEQAGHSAVFSKDGQYFFVPSGSSIKIYSVETLRVVSTLSPLRSLSTSTNSPSPSHTDLVTSVLLNPSNPLQLYSASLDGTIKTWDWLEGILLQSFNFGKPISHLCAHAEAPNVVFVAARSAQVAMKQKHGNIVNSKADCTVAKISLADQTQQQSRKIGKKIAPVTGLSMSPDGKFLIAIAATTAHIALTSSPEKGWIKFVSPDGIQLTRLVCHPSRNYFATGDKSGHIRIWDCLQDESQLTFEKLGVAKTPTTRLLHWHAHEVGALNFTPNGAFLISGGAEAVMVLWNMDTGRKGNVPRVGAPIQGISTVDRPDVGQEILLGLADGSYAVYNVTKARFRTQTGAVKLDGSVLAVAHGPYVTLWNGQTHSLLQALSSLPFSKVNTVHFAGTNGRYLVVSGDAKDVIVWDVLQNKALRRLSTPPITTLDVPKTSRRPLVVPIPNSDEFAVAVRHPNQTFISIHSPFQSDPIRIRTLPFHVLRLAPLPTSNSQQHMMAAVAADGSVSLVGDDLTVLPQREGDVERSLSGKNALSTRTSLFENVFGRSAFKDLENVDGAPQANAGMDGADDRFGAAVDLRLLDGPAYLLPPIESLFTSLMEGVLVKPGTAVEVQEADQETRMDLDVEEVVEETVAPAPFVRPRDVDDSEISMLVNLFSQHALIAPISTKKGSRLVNGAVPKKALVNGKAHVNGVAASSSTHLPSPSPTPSPVASIPPPKHKAKQKLNGIMHPSPSTGQKRKVPPTS